MRLRSAALTKAIPTRTALWLGLVLYGILLAALCVGHLADVIPDPPRLGGSRTEGIAAATRTLETGGPPLLECTAPYDEARPLDGCVPAGTTDDQGLYLYLPVLAQLAGFDSPPLALKWLYIGLFALLTLVSPLIFYGLFESLAAALVAPAAIAYRFDLFADTELYWIGPWCYLLCLPLLLLVYRRWGRWSLAALAGVVAIGSFATSIRVHTGLPILLGALVVLLLRRTTILRLAAGAAVLVVAYLSFAFLLTGVREYRDRVVGAPGLSDRYPSRHPFWHNVYIGLGHLPNRYGIEWNDSVSIEFVRAKDPNAGYLTPRYEHILRDEFFRILRHDSQLVVNNVVTKLGKTLDASRSNFGVVLLLAPLALFVGRARFLWRRYFLIAAPMLLLSLPPPLLTLPIVQYQLAWLGAWATLWLLLACWALTVLPAEISRKLEERRRRTDTRRGARKAAARVIVRSPATWLTVGLLLVMSLFADVLGPRAVRAADRNFWADAAAPLREPRSSALARWEFSSAVPADWTTGAGASARPLERAFQIVTNPGRSEYQLVGPIVLLSAGRYEARVRGRVVHGGLELGVLNVDREVWLQTSRYWHGQRGYESGELVTPFELEKPLRVRVILANWQGLERPSTWIVERITITRA